MQRKRISTEVFKLDFYINQPKVQYVKSGSTLNGKSSHLEKMAGDGHCFCSVSFLLTGNHSQQYKICQQLCDYIESEKNVSKLRAFLGHHNTGKDYVLSSKMRQHAWATEVEMISLAILTGKDLVCYYNQKWKWHPASGNVANPIINAIYMDNSSGCHFNAVVGLWNFLSSKFPPSHFLLLRFLPSLFLSSKHTKMHFPVHSSLPITLFITIRVILLFYDLIISHDDWKPHYNLHSHIYAAYVLAYDQLNIWQFYQHNHTDHTGMFSHFLELHEPLCVILNPMWT